MLKLIWFMNQEEPYGCVLEHLKGISKALGPVSPTTLGILCFINEIP